MLINGTVNITMSGGLVPHGDAGSSIVLMAPAMIVRANPNTQSGGQAFLGGGMHMGFSPQVIHSGEVSINDPNQPQPPP